MNISKITLTGADDGIDPHEMAAISEENPRVEWGILFSKKRDGTNRYPSHGWLRRLAEIKRGIPAMNLSAHLCGQWAMSAAEGEWSVMHDRADVMPVFERIQINLAGEARFTDWAPFIRSLTRRSILGKQIIMQYRDDGLYKLLTTPGCDLVPLFDRSGGQGILPARWPAQLRKVVQTGSGARTVRELLRGRETLMFCGYAGGLDPDNIGAELAKIEDVAAGNVWIDAETGLRENAGVNFCLAKIGKFLDAVYGFERGVAPLT